MFGKEKCRILKEIRQKIADENEIPFVTQECRHQGNCSGTCPRCESELRYLEQQLDRRAALGKRITVTALCAGIAFSGAACGVGGPEYGGAPTLPTETVTPADDPETPIVMGELAMPFEEESPEPYARAENTPPAECTPPAENTAVPADQFELSGMVSYDG